MGYGRTYTSKSVPMLGAHEKARSTRARRRGKLLLSLQFAVSHFYFVADLVLGRFVVRERT